MERPSTATLRELAVKASVDPRTLTKVLRGEPVRGMAAHRAAAVLKAAGYALPQVPEGGRP